MLIDCHAHLFWPSYDPDLSSVLNRATEAGVAHIIVPGTNFASTQAASLLATSYPHFLSFAAGIHPETINNPNVWHELDSLNIFLKKSPKGLVAIGEIGLDLGPDCSSDSLSLQIKLFRTQIQLALDYDLPVILHTRKTFTETLAILDSFPRHPRGVFHCFSYDAEAIKAVLTRGYHISFCGNITWSKRLQKLVPLVPLSRLLLETDSPFMLPRFPDGSPLSPDLRNEPAFVTMLASAQASLYQVTLTALSEATTHNAQNLFHL